MQLPPHSVIETWPTPNYVDPTTAGPAIIIMHSVLFPITLLFICVRLFSRLKLSNTFGIDDTLIVAAFIPATAFGVISLILLYKLHWDRHIWDVPLRTSVLGLKLTLASEILFSLASSLTRISILFMTRRIIATSKGLLRSLTNIAVAFIIAEYLTFILVVLLSCRPISALWTSSLTPPHCIDIRLHLLVAGILNTVSDFLVVLLPIPVVLRLSLPRRQLVVVTMLFGVGFLVCGAGAARTYYTYMVKATFDSTWYGYRAMLSSSFELYIGIICASVPPTKAFFARYIPRLLSNVHLSSFPTLLTRDPKVFHMSTSTPPMSRLSSSRGVSAQVDAAGTELRDTYGRALAGEQTWESGMLRGGITVRTSIRQIGARNSEEVTPMPMTMM